MYKNNEINNEQLNIKGADYFSSDILEIARKIELEGGRLYLVGGAIRDNLLGIKSVQDEDFCVVGISPEKFCNLFPSAIKRGKFFEVFDINNKEFALARKEKKSGKGHKEFEIIADGTISIEDDLKRRDITINAIAKDVLTGEIIDPYNGMIDIKNKIIRAVSDKFKEDPLRAYRVARFASSLNFKVDENTIGIMKEIKEELNTLSPERVFNELRKALKTNKPSKFFNILRKADILDVHFKEISKLIGAEQPIKYHPEGDAYNHTMLALEMSTKLTQDEIVRFCVLVHDLGKGVTPKEMYPHHIGHDIKGVKEVENLCNRLKMPNSWKKCGKVAAREHMRAGIFDNMKTSKKVTFIENISKTMLGLNGLEIVVECDRNCRGTNKDRVEFAKIGNKMLKEINGEFIKKKYNISEGIKLQEKLHQERINWLENYNSNT